MRESPRLLLREPFDERTVWEVSRKGWYSGATVELPDGSRHPIFFYDPVRLAQDLQAEIESDRPPVRGRAGNDCRSGDHRNGHARGGGALVPTRLVRAAASCSRQRLMMAAQGRPRRTSWPAPYYATCPCLYSDLNSRSCASSKQATIFRNFMLKI